MKIILGLAGEMASGKGTVAKYLAEKQGASIYRFSTILRDILDRLFLEQTRGNIQKLSTALRRTFGEDTLARVIAEEVKEDKNKIIVVDGVRRLDDIKYLRKIPHFKLVYIETELEKRYQRIIKRSENIDDRNKTFAEFKKESQYETEITIRELKKYAEIILDNNGSLEKLYEQIDGVVRGL